MGIIRADQGLIVRCVICGRKTNLNDVDRTASQQNQSHRNGGWFLHIHKFSPIGSFDTEDTFGFCPDHAPDQPFPTLEDNPDYKINELNDDIDRLERELER